MFQIDRSVWGYRDPLSGDLNTEALALLNAIGKPAELGYELCCRVISLYIACLLRSPWQVVISRFWVACPWAASGSFTACHVRWRLEAVGHASVRPRQELVEAHPWALGPASRCDESSLLAFAAWSEQVGTGAPQLLENAQRRLKLPLVAKHLSKSLRDVELRGGPAQKPQLDTVHGFVS